MAEEVAIISSFDNDDTVRGMLEIEKATAETVKSVEELEDTYKDLQKQIKKTKPNSKEWKKLNKEITATEKALDGANKELKQTDKSAKAASGSIAEMQEELESLTDQISGVAVGSAEFDELSSKIRKLDGELSTANESLVGLSSEDKASRIGQLAGGLGSVAASAALIGGEDSAIADFFGGIESALGIMVGLQGAIEAVAAAKKLMSVASIQATAATTAETAAMGGAAVATGAQTAATGAATTSMWAFNASLLANPIFWIVAVIMAVVAAFAILASSTKTAAAEHEEMNAALERQGELIESNRKSRERANAALQNELANKEKLLQAELDLLEATEDRGVEEEARISELKKQLGTIDEESLDILGEETRKRIDENTRLMTDQLKAAQKGVTAVWQEDWGSPDFDYGKVRQYFNDVNDLQLKATKLYQQANEATTEEERQEYIKRAQTVEEQVTQKTARIKSRLESIKRILGSDAAEQMETVIEDITKFGDRANESADAMAEYQQALDNFSTDNMVEELQKSQEAEEEAAKKREEARKRWKEFISEQMDLREELTMELLSEQDRELRELELWLAEKQKLTGNDAELQAQLAEVYEKKKQEITDKFAKEEEEKARARAAGLLEIERTLVNDRNMIASMQLAAAVGMAEEETEAKLEAWSKALEGNRAISDQELADLREVLAKRRDAIIEGINQEREERRIAAQQERDDAIRDAEEKIKTLQENGLAEADAQRQLADLKLQINANYNAAIQDADDQAAADRRAAQKDYHDAELAAEEEQKAKLEELNQAHHDKLIEGLETISSALDESVGQFEGALGQLAGAVSAGVSQLGGALLGMKEQIAEIKAKTAEGVTLTPEEEQALKESTAQAVSAVVGAAGAVAQGIVDTIAESNRAKAELALQELEANKQRELEIIQNAEDAGTLTKEEADKKRQQLEFKAAKEKYDIEKKAFENEKKAKIATAVISGITGAVSAFAGAMQLGPIAGPIVGGILAAAVAAMTAVNVANIKKTKFGGTPPKPATGGGGGAGGAASTPAAVNPANLLPTGSESGNELGTNQGGGQQGQPQQTTIKAVVVETDITDTQNNVSAIEERSEFG